MLIGFDPSSVGLATDTLLLRDPVGHDQAGARAVDWENLSEPLQVMLAGAALRRALVTAARHAETLACAMEDGTLQDHGGPDALRLFATMMQVTAEDGLGGADPRGGMVG